jgi:hypothetical protein
MAPVAYRGFFFGPIVDDNATYQFGKLPVLRKFRGLSNTLLNWTDTERITSVMWRFRHTTGTI